MRDDIVENLATWRVVGLTCDMQEPRRTATVVLRLQSTVHDGKRTIKFTGVTPEAAFQQFPLLNASLLIVDTSARGWEAERRYEITDTDDEGPYLHAAEFIDDEPQS